MKKIFYGRNINNKPTIANSGDLNQLLRDFGDDQFQLTVEKRFKKRSNQQSNYYWGCCIPAVIDGLIDNGYPKSELNSEVVHLMLREKFLRTELVSEQTGEVISRIKSTTELSTVDFLIFIEDIQRWSSEILNIYIADPNSQAEMSLKF